MIALLGVGQFGIPGDTLPASAAVYDASAHPLKFRSSSLVPITSGATGRSVGDVVRFNSVTTIDGMVIDAVVRTVAIQQATIGKFDNGTALNAPPLGSSQSVDDLLLTDIANTSGATQPMVTLEFSFYEGGTYTGIGTGIPLTLANVAINAYDIDGLSSTRQFVDFRGFQSYKSYTDSGDPNNKGLNVLDQGDGLVRFISKSATLGAAANTGSYSWSRVQVNYDHISTLTVRLGVVGAQGAYYALDFSVGGTWTTDGVNPVTPTEANNPFNTPPTTEDITTFYAAQDTGYVFRAADFPYSDVDDNAFASVRIMSLPSTGAGILEHFNGADWIPVTAGQIIPTNDLDLGVLRLMPTSTGGGLTFQVSDGLAFSATRTLTFTAPANSQTISFPTPATQDGNAEQTFASGATVSSGLTPTLTSLTPGVCTVSGLTVKTLPLPSGVVTATCVIAATQDGDASYGRAQAVTRQFPVTTLSAQTITFDNPGDRTFASTPIPSGATSDSGLTVTLTSLTPAVCTVSGLTIQPVTPGSCRVGANQPGDATYSPASPVTQTFTLLKVAQTISFDDPGDRTFSSTPIDSGATANSGLIVTLTSLAPAVCTVSGLAIQPVTPGACSVQAAQAGDATRAAATPVTRTFDLQKVPQIITFAMPPTATFDSGPVTFSPTTDASGLAVTLTSITPDACTVSGFTVTFIAPGVCTVAAAQTGDVTRAAAADVTRSFQIIGIATTTLDSARAGTPFSQQLVIAGALGGGVWSATGLPAGLSLNSATGVLSGIPSGAFNGTVTISYTEDGVTQLITLALEIDAAASSLPTSMAVTGAESAVAAGISGLLLLAGAGLTLASIAGRRQHGRHAR